MTKINKYNNNAPTKQAEHKALEKTKTPIQRSIEQGKGSNARLANEPPPPAYSPRHAESKPDKVVHLMEKAVAKVANRKKNTQADVCDQLIELGRDLHRYKAESNEKLNAYRILAEAVLNQIDKNQPELRARGLAHIARFIASEKLEGDNMSTVGFKKLEGRELAGWETAVKAAFEETEKISDTEKRLKAFRSIKKTLISTQEHSEVAKAIGAQIDTEPMIEDIRKDLDTAKKQRDELQEQLTKINNQKKGSEKRKKLREYSSRVIKFKEEILGPIDEKITKLQDRQLTAEQRATVDGFRTKIQTLY